MSKLKAKKPENERGRFKALLSGKAGIGKTIAAISMPRPYIIDTEWGTKHYADAIAKNNGVVYRTTDFDEVIDQVHALMSEPHDYLTLVIDSYTKLFEEKREEGANEVGTEWGRHTSYAEKWARRIGNLIAQIDMNVVVTAHSKKEYGEITNNRGKKETVVIGETFDGYKKLDYDFDTWFSLFNNTASSR